MIKKILTVFFTIILALVIAPSSFVYAEDPCDVDPDSQECKIQKALESSSRISELYAQIAEAEDNLDEALDLANSYREQAQKIEVDIQELTVRIDELSLKIEDLRVRIEENQAKVDALNKRVLDRMADSQKNMHFNPFLDFVLGAHGFADMLRRTYGVEAIMSKEESDRNTLIDTINQLTLDKEELDKAKAELDASKEELVNKQAELLVMNQYYRRIADEMAARIEEIQNALEDEKNNYSELLSFIDDLSSLPSAEGFYSPIKGATISAGFPYYPASFGGGVHLGVDYAVGYQTPIYAPASGIILVSYNGCGYGYLGCSCGGDGNGNGVSYGGNQIYMMTSVNNKVYAITFSHLYQAVAERYSVVLAGDLIGYVGSSGNSSGPHSHIELFYLGEGDFEDIQETYLFKDYSSSFNCGWGSYALRNNCDRNGYSAPCRLDGSLYFN